MSRRRQPKTDRPSFVEACDLVDAMDDDLSDGAYWAMVEDISGVPLCDGVDQLEAAGRLTPVKPWVDPLLACDVCRKRFATHEAKCQHWRDKCGKGKS